jgi:ketosteroid isomerase-like protein
VTPHKDLVEHPNVGSYWRMIEAFNVGDLSTASQFLDPGIIYTMPGRSPLAGRTEGVAAHLQMLGRARELSEGTLRLVPCAVAASGEHVLVYGRIRAARAGKSLDCDHCVVFRYKSGRIVEGRTVPVDLYSFDEFWL